MTADIQYICPLKIPQGHNLTFQRQRRYDNGFPQSLTIDSAVQYLEDELKQLPDAQVKIFTNYDRLNSPRTRAKREDDSAVCLEIRSGSRIYYLLSDRWYPIEHNLYALHLTVRAFINITKWGVADLPTLLSGFDAAARTLAGMDEEDDGTIKPEWMKLLGLGSTATLEDANSVYRRRAKEAAEDEHKLLELNRAIEAARKYFGGV